VHLVGEVVEKEGHRLVRLGCREEVAVVQHQDPLHLR
jgi:hypothetical protein